MPFDEFQRLGDTGVGVEAKPTRLDLLEWKDVQLLVSQSKELIGIGSNIIETGCFALMDDIVRSALQLQQLRPPKSVHFHLSRPGVSCRRQAVSQSRLER